MKKKTVTVEVYILIIYRTLKKNTVLGDINLYFFFKNSFCIFMKVGHVDVNQILNNFTFA